MSYSAPPRPRAGLAAVVVVLVMALTGCGSSASVERSGARGTASTGATRATSPSGPATPSATLPATPSAAPSAAPSAPSAPSPSSTSGVPSAATPPLTPATSEDLQELITAIAKDKPKMSIAVQELDGAQRTASVHGRERLHPASTYKLFVAYTIIKRIESGALTWPSPVASTTVDRCMTRMIVDSDNACALTLAHRVGWSQIAADATSIGAVDTAFPRGVPRSSVEDEVLLLAKLERGELMNEANRDKLLDLMRRQTHREGIPDGVDAPVADKPGWIGALLRDSGIVYSPRGTYVISVFTNRGSWHTISSTVEEIDELLGR